MKKLFITFLSLLIYFSCCFNCYSESTCDISKFDRNGLAYKVIRDRVKVASELLFGEQIDGGFQIVSINNFEYRDLKYIRVEVGAIVTNNDNKIKEKGVYFVSFHEVKNLDLIFDLIPESIVKIDSKFGDDLLSVKSNI